MQSSRLGFLSPFGTPAFASWTLLFPPGDSPSSQTACLPRALLAGPDGVSVFRVVEIRPGWVPPLRRDGGAHAAGTASPAATCRLSAADPVLRPCIPSPEVLITTHTEVHCTFTRPAFPDR